ncbi:hypothetical protein JOC33_002621 [Thalassobacillus pellis]|nr:hypothetical protein [Thalassobacillus pellis]
MQVSLEEERLLRFYCLIITDEKNPSCADPDESLLCFLRSTKGKDLGEALMKLNQKEAAQWPR